LLMKRQKKVVRSRESFTRGYLNGMIQRKYKFRRKAISRKKKDRIRRLYRSHI
jgi:hypothetical protein